MSCSEGADSLTRPSMDVLCGEFCGTGTSSQILRDSFLQQAFINPLPFLILCQTHERSHLFVTTALKRAKAIMIFTYSLSMVLCKRSPERCIDLLWVTQLMSGRAETPELRLLTISGSQAREFSKASLVRCPQFPRGGW